MVQVCEQDVAFYREQGYLVVENVLDEVTRRRILGVIEQLTEQARGLNTHNDVYDLEPTHRPEAPRVRRVKRPHLVHPIFNELVRSAPFLAVQQALLGRNIRLHGSKLNIKAPRYGSPVEWHQDWAFYPHTNDDILAIGVMLDDVDEDNGCMLVVPGSHHGPTYDHHDDDGHFLGAMDPSASGIDFGKAVAVTGKAGSASFHHVRLVHGSAQNFSAKPRHLLLYETAGADAWPLLGAGNFDDFNGRMICGTPTIQPRVVPTPVRMPLPPAKFQGSIYENQTALAISRRYFRFEQPPAASHT